MRVGSIFVLLLAGDLKLVGHILSGLAHVVVVVNVPETIIDHGIDNHVIAHAEAFARGGHEIGCVGHGLHATGNHDFRITGLDGLCSESHGLEAGTADLVDGHGANLRRESAFNGSLARRVLSKAGLENIAHDAFIHEIEIGDAGTLNGFAHNDGAKIGGAEIGESALEFSDGGTNRRYDNDIFQRCHEECSW